MWHDQKRLEEQISESYWHSKHQLCCWWHYNLEKSGCLWKLLKEARIDPGTCRRNRLCWHCDCSCVRVMSDLPSRSAKDCAVLNHRIKSLGSFVTTAMGDKRSFPPTWFSFPWRTCEERVTAQCIWLINKAGFFFSFTLFPTSYKPWFIYFARVQTWIAHFLIFKSKFVTALRWSLFLVAARHIFSVSDGTWQELAANLYLLLSHC